MTQGMHCCKLGNTCLADCFFNDILNGRIADMMAAHFPGARISRCVSLSSSGVKSADFTPDK